VNIEKALNTVKTIQSQLRPYAAYMPEAKQLDDIIKSLEAGNAVTALEQLKTFRSAVEKYKAMAPARVQPLLDAIDGVIKDLQ
jgi:hypothetical protein